MTHIDYIKTKNSIVLKKNKAAGEEELICHHLKKLLNHILTEKIGKGKKLSIYLGFLV